MLRVECGRNGAVESRCGVRDVDGEPVIGLDEIERYLRIVLVRLRAMGKTYGPKVSAIDTLDGQLGQATGKGRILTTGNAEDKALSAGVAQIRGEEVDTAFNLLCRINERFRP